MSVAGCPPQRSASPCPTGPDRRPAGLHPQAHVRAIDVGIKWMAQLSMDGLFQVSTEGRRRPSCRGLAQSHRLLAEVTVSTPAPTHAKTALAGSAVENNNSRSVQRPAEGRKT